jgi:hypothetical protein
MAAAGGRHKTNGTRHCVRERRVFPIPELKYGAYLKNKNK